MDPLTNDKIPYSSFEQLDLRVGTILSAEEHPNADKLLVLSVDLGESEPRTIVAGIKSSYTLEELKGKQAIFVANLAPVTLRGVESNGMILAASDPPILLQPDKTCDPGTKIK